jgi:phosphohistidine swiveling domain-containing protein
VIAATHLRPLADAGDEHLFGGKAAGLAALIRGGVPTPAGVVIDTRAFDAHLARCGLGDAAAALMADLAHMPPQALEARSSALRARMLHEPIDAALAAALHAHLERRRPGVRLAVRSSAVGEDAPDASFAGQFDSVLDVDTPAALEHAVRQVWASAYGARALRYGQYRQVRPASMAVIVQEQVDAMCSGVLFTRDPSRPQDEHLLTEYCAGLGDRLVLGALTPAHARIAREGLHIEVEHPGDDGLELDPRAMATVVELARHALALERKLGHALDIEWSIARDGTLMLLQCRPMTAVAQMATQELWSNANIAENFPGPVVPFLRSFVARGYAGYFRGLGLAFGISRRRMAAMAPALDGLVGVHAGRLYYNLSNIHTVLHLAPGGPWLARFFNQFTGADGTPVPRLVASALPARIAEALRVVCKVPWQYTLVQRRVRRFERRVDAFADRTHPRDLPQASMPELAQRLRGFLDIRLNRWTDAALADTAAMVCYGLLQALLDRWLAGRDRAQLQNNLLQGLPGLASAAPVEKLWALAQRARADEPVLAVLRGATAEAALQALQSPAHAPFRAALEEYLEHWGFRYSGELMLTQPTPAESPWSVIRLLQTYLAEDRAGPTQITAERAAERLASTAKVAAALTPSSLLRHLPLPTRARCFRLLLTATQGAIRLRERARMKQALLYTRLRHVALALGERLVEQQALQARDDVFYLTIDEAIALAQGDDALRPQLRATVDSRRAEFLVCEAASPPDQFSLAAGSAWVQDSGSPPGVEQQPGATMQGIGACGGSVVGPAAVVLDVTQADTLSAGTILVTRQTDPGWAAVFFLVKGLVVERGGMLSHGAIIAREYGIPAVVGVRGATQWIRSGDRVRVNGDAGLVELLDG